MSTTRYMSRIQAGLKPPRQPWRRGVDHQGQACAHWSATKQTPRASRAIIADDLDKPRKPGLKWYRLWRNPLTDSVQRRRISRKIRAYNKARRAFNEATKPNPMELRELDRQAAAIARSFQQSHFNRGWIDLGYHELIFAHGLRIGGRPRGTHGAHAGARANWMLGVCFVMGPGDEVTPEMIEAARECEADNRVKLRHAHFDFMATQCCGPSIAQDILGRAV